MMTWARRGDAALILGLALGLVAGCGTQESDEVAQEPALDAVSSDSAAAVEPAAAAEPSFAEQVVVSDGPPQELRFSSSLNSRERDLINREFADKLAASRGAATTTAAEFDLNADGASEVFVIIKSDGWCGSGDVCNMWLYQQNGDQWQLISSGTDAASCVSILPTATSGYRDVRLHGQCAVNMCTFDLRWDGERYAWDGNRDCDPLAQ